MALSELVDDRVSTPTAPNSPYLPGLDGLRALAVVAVLLYHAGYNVVGGFLGVESWFVRSGCVNTTVRVTGLGPNRGRRRGAVNVVAG